MKVLDLRCAGGHIFEGWFGSEDDYLNQKETGLLQCPVCGAVQIEKMLSAPRVQAKSNTKKASPKRGKAPNIESTEAGTLADHSDKTMPAPLEHVAQSIANLPADVQAQLQSHWLQVAREMVSKADDVGTDFANEARRIHYGDAPERAIHGQATLQEAKELIDEGVAVLPLPDGVKNTMQ